MRKALFILICIALASCGGRTAEKSPVTVMSFNVRYANTTDGNDIWENRKGAAVKMISELKPDIIGLQEALAGQNAYLAEQLPQYGQVGVGRDDGAQGGEIMTILYDSERYDLLDAGSFWLSETPDEVSRGWDAACNRTATWVYLMEKGSGRKFFMFNTHLDHMGQTARKEGIKLLVRRIDEITENPPLYGKAYGKPDRNTPVFITGDFNAAPQDEAVQPLFSQFGSARDNAPQTDKLGTFNGFGSAPNSIVIDYIFYRNAAPESFRTVTENWGVPYVSDHYPIVARFVF